MRLSLPALAVLALASACHPSGAASPSSGDPQWLVLRVDTVQVAPTRAGTSSPWDIPAPESSHGAECALLGIAGTFLLSPIAGKGAEYLCTIGARPHQQEQDPSAPDLVVGLGAGAATNYQTYTARDSFYHVFRSEFLVPTDAIPPEGLLLTVFDRDGAQSEIIGALRLQRTQLVDALHANPLLTLGDPSGGLTRLELVVSAHDAQAESLTVPMDSRAGTIAPTFRPIRAGEILDIKATGQYKIGGFLHPKSIDPRGYPDGEARSYNFENEPFQSAPHGSGLAMVGMGDAKMGQSVAPCTRFVSRVSGPLMVGINDTDPTNNEGSAQFAIQTALPSAAEWLGAQTTNCTGR